MGYLKFGSEGVMSALPRKASSCIILYPYRKPTQVVEAKAQPQVMRELVKEKVICNFENSRRRRSE